MSKKLPVALRSILMVAVAATTLTFSSPARATWFSCEPDEVLEFSTRVHVRCRNSITVDSNVIRYLALGKSDAPKLERFISLATAAMLRNGSFRVDVPSSSSDNPSGCATSDCRAPSTFGVR